MLQKQGTKTILDGRVKERAIIYCRVSTDEQAEHGTSLNNQTEKSLAYAESKGLNVIAIFKEDYTGTTLDRPELNKVRKMLQAGQADVLIAYNNKRLDRSKFGVNTLRLIVELEALGVQLHFSENNHAIDFSNHFDVLMYGNLGGWQAGKDRDDTVKKLKEGKENRVKEGYVVTAHTPYGYDKIEIGKRKQLQINEDEALIVKMIFELYTGGKSLYGVARHLSKLEIVTPASRGKSIKKHKKTTNWGRSSISKILNHSVYIGQWMYGKNKRINGKNVKREGGPIGMVEVPAIIDNDTWQIAQHRLENNLNRTPNKNYLLSGILSCGCGSTMSGEKSKNDTHYRCTSRTKKKHCGASIIRTNKIDDLVWNWLTHWVMQFTQEPEKAEQLLKEYQAQTAKEVNPIQKEITILDSLISQHTTELQREIDNLRYLKSDRAKVTIGLEIERIEGTLNELEAKRELKQSQIEHKSITDDQIGSMAELLVQLAADWQVISRSVEAQQQVLRLLQANIEIIQKDGELIVWFTGILQSGPKKLGDCRSDSDSG